MFLFQSTNNHLNFVKLTRTRTQMMKTKKSCTPNKPNRKDTLPKKKYSLPFARCRLSIDELLHSQRGSRVLGLHILFYATGDTAEGVTGKGGIMDTGWGH